jgi:hypothetical protein
MAASTLCGDAFGDLPGRLTARAGRIEPGYLDELAAMVSRALGVYGEDFRRASSPP